MQHLGTWAFISQKTTIQPSLFVCCLLPSQGCRDPRSSLILLFGPARHHEGRGERHRNPGSYSSTVPEWSWEFGKLQDSCRISTVWFANRDNSSTFLRELPWSTQHRACCAMNHQSTVSNIATARCCACKDQSGAPLDFGPQQTKVKCVPSLT